MENRIEPAETSVALAFRKAAEKRESLMQDLLRANQPQSDLEEDLDTESVVVLPADNSAEFKVQPEPRPKKEPIRIPEIAVANAVLQNFSTAEVAGHIILYKSRSAKQQGVFALVPPAQLKTSHDDARVAEGMVASAIVQKWGAIQSSGSPEFRSNIFYHAVRMGVEVSNYQPTPADLDRIAKEKIEIPEWVKKCTNQIQPAARKQNMNKAAAPGLSP